VVILTGLAHDQDDLLGARRGRSSLGACRVLRVFVARRSPTRYPGSVARERRRPAASTATIETCDMARRSRLLA
jgi:hypothetical protein